MLTDDAFTRKDIINIQDPKHLDKFNIAEFYHVRKNIKVLDKGMFLVYSHNNNYFQLIFEQYLTLPILSVLKKYETDLIFRTIDSQNSALQVKPHALMSNFGTQA